MKRSIGVSVVTAAILVALIFVYPSFRRQNIAPVATHLSPFSTAMSLQEFGHSGDPILENIEGLEDSLANSEDKSCPPSPKAMTRDEYSEKLEQEFRQVMPILESSDVAEFVLAASLLRPLLEEGGDSDLLAAAQSLDSRSPLIAWNQLLRCSADAAMNCDYAAARDRAVSIDGSNGAVWITIAAQELSIGRTDAGTEAVRRAISAPRFDIYWSEHIQLLDRAFAASTNWSFVERINVSTGFVAAKQFPFKPLYEKCRSPGDEIAVWAELCDQLGQRMFEDGDTLISKGIGLGLRRISANFSDDAEAVHFATTESAKFSVAYRELMPDQATTNLMANDERVLTEFLQTYATYGELEAFKRLQEEKLRLQLLPGYDQCNFVNPYGY